MTGNDRITINPAVLVGKPVVSGTRLAVEFLLGLKGAGWTDVQILESYPRLSADDLQAVFSYAATLVREKFCPPVEVIP